MKMATERLKVILEMAAGQYKREARDAATATGRISTETKSAKTQMSGFGTVLRSAAVIGGITAVGRGLWSAVKAAEQSASALANTEQIIKETGGAANVTADDIVELSRKLSAMTGVQDEVVQEGANVLLTFKNLRNEAGEGNDVFDRTVGLMLDVGSVMGTDASSAALQLGKALNDPVSQMGALSRAGLTFNTEQKNIIKTMVEAGDLMGAQKIILSELESQLGGTAAASADASDKISNSFGQIGESIGALLLPALETAATELLTITGLIDELDRLSTITGQDRQSAELLAGALFQLGQEYDNIIRDGGKSADVLERFTLEAEELIDIAGLSVGELEKVRGGLDFLVDSMGLSSEQAEVLASVLDEKLNYELARLTDIGADQVLRGQLIPAFTETGNVLTGNLNPALGETRDRIRRGEMTWQQYGSVVEDTTGQIEANMAAHEAFFDLMDARTDSLRNVSDAQETVAEKQDAVTESLDTFGANSPEYLAALDDLSIANQALRTAQRRLIEQGGLTRAEFIDQQVEMGLTYDQAVILAAQYDDLFTPRHVVNTITNKITNTTTGGGGGGAVVSKALAAGGPVSANETVLVGEQGPELFTPHTAGQILPNQVFNTDTKELVAALSKVGETAKAGPTINLNGPINGADEIMAAVQRAAGLGSMVDLAEVNPR